ncbi:MAG: 2-amino-4-hydroxy-6-hydroxymethyldihydropteridine diphosphokinase [Woeseiaceae bacterium]|nr:2-amino-4-hydroxy-6-hydroxymethyldihydropteridine diphosphokinase [Woeseiaceae bacterium]
MSMVYLGLGSNIRPEENLSFAVRELRRRYGELDVSSVYRSAALGFEGADFLNLVVGFRSDDSPEDICAEIERLHNLAGRQRGDDKWAPRPLDIDLLLYDDQVIDDRQVKVPRSDVLEYSFVLRPLAELAPDLVHPVTGKTMQTHWQEFDAGSHPLELVGVIL